jgi:hypothetical protein
MATTVCRFRFIWLLIVLAPTVLATLSLAQTASPVGSVYQIPYTIHPSSGDVANINAAVSNYNSIFSGIIQWVSHTSETNYVNVKRDPSDTGGVGNS